MIQVVCVAELGKVVWVEQEGMPYHEYVCDCISSDHVICDNRKTHQAEVEGEDPSPQGA